MIGFIASYVVAGQQLVIHHLPWSMLAAGVVAVVGGMAAMLLHRMDRPERVTYPDPEQGLARGSDGLLHGIWAGYDGDGVYAWSCRCGEACSDFQGLDYATQEGTQHLIDVDALVAA